MYISGITAFGVPGSLDELSSDLIAESYGIRMAAIQRTIDLKNCVNGKTVLRKPGEKTLEEGEMTFERKR